MTTRRGAKTVKKAFYAVKKLPKSKKMEKIGKKFKNFIENI